MQKEKHQRGIRTRWCPRIVPTTRRQRLKHIQGAYKQGREWQECSEGDRSHDTNYENTGLFNIEVLKEVRNSQVEVNINENGNVEWILDSGCTDHDNNKQTLETKCA